MARQLVVDLQSLGQAIVGAAQRDAQSQLNNLRVNEFSLNVQIKRAPPPDTGKVAGKEKAA